MMPTIKQNDSPAGSIGRPTRIEHAQRWMLELERAYLSMTRSTGATQGSAGETEPIGEGTTRGVAGPVDGASEDTLSRADSEVGVAGGLPTPSEFGPWRSTDRMPSKAVVPTATIALSQDRSGDVVRLMGRRTTLAGSGISTQAPAAMAANESPPNRGATLVPQRLPESDTSVLDSSDDLATDLVELPRAPREAAAPQRMLTIDGSGNVLRIAVHDTALARSEGVRVGDVLRAQVNRHGYSVSQVRVNGQVVWSADPLSMDPLNRVTALSSLLDA